MIVGRALTVIAVAIAIFALGAVVGSSRGKRPVYHRDVVQEPVWAIYIVPPCEESALSDVPIGATWQLARDHVAGVMEAWPITGLRIGKGYSHVRDGQSVCP